MYTYEYKDIDITFFNHEQSASFAVESYTKLTGEISLCVVTTGPGATNAITGLSAAWLDSIPSLFISGQARSNNIISGRSLRQVGTQEIDIIPVVNSLTNFSSQVSNISQIREKLLLALSHRLYGRPGPVWLDIPVDILWSEYNEDLLTKDDITQNIKSKNKNDIHKILEDSLLKSSKPLLLLGGGCRSPEIKNLSDILDKINLPFVTTWLGFDLIEFRNKNNLGHIGMAGHRGGNLAVGNCDLLIVIGSSVSTSVTTTKTENFASNALRININVEEKDFDHTRNFFHYNLKESALNIFKILEKITQKDIQKDWIDFRDLCKELTSNEMPEKNSFIHPFSIFRSLEECADDNAIFVSDGGGTTVYSSFQSIRPKKNQRLILSTGLCSMGSGIPEAIGVSKSNRPTYLFCGDGSFPFNIQELQLIKDQEIPILITVFSNNAYLSIRSTQNEFLDGKQIGSTTRDVHLIDIKKISQGFELEYIKINSLSQFEAIVKNWTKKPIVLEIETDPNQEIQPRQSFRKINGGFQPEPLTRMAPLCSEQIQKKIDVYDQIFNSTQKREIFLTEKDQILLKNQNNMRLKYEDEIRKFKSIIFKSLEINETSSLQELGFNEGNPLISNFKDTKNKKKSCYLNYSRNLKDNNDFEEFKKCYYSTAKNYDHIIAINFISFFNKHQIFELLKLIEQHSIKDSYITLETWNSSYEKTLMENSGHGYATILTKPDWIRMLDSASFTGRYSFFSQK